MKYLVLSLLLCLLSCSTVRKERQFYQVTNINLSKGYYILDTPDVELGVLVFDQRDVITVQSDTTLLMVVYDLEPRKVNSIFLFYQQQINL